jgi:hypothetical protein
LKIDYIKINRVLIKCILKGNHRQGTEFSSHRKGQLLANKIVVVVLLLLVKHYGLLILAVASLTIDSHSVLSKALFIHLFTPIFLKYDTASSILPSYAWCSLFYPSP